MALLSTLQSLHITVREVCNGIEVNIIQCILKIALVLSPF